MTLRRKTLFSLLTILLACLLALFALAAKVILEGFSSVEETQTRRDMARVQEAIGQEVERVDAVCNDWAGWDEPYNFLGGTNPGFAKNILNAAQLSALKVDDFLLFDARGKLIYSTGIDWHKLRLHAVSPSLLGHLHQHPKLLRHHTIHSAHKGFLFLKSGAVIYSSRPVLNSFKSGKVRGTLVITRRLDGRQMALFSRISGFSLSLVPAKSPTLLNPSHQPNLAIERPDDRVLAAYAPLDKTSSPLWLRVEKTRDVWAQGQKSLGTLMLAMLATCLVFALLARELIGRLVLCRIEVLERELREVTARGDWSARITQDGEGDDVSLLTQTVNGLLASVESGQKSLQESQNRFLAFMDNSPTIVFIKDREGCYVYVNARFHEWFGVKGDPVGKNDFDFWPPDTARTLRENDLRVWEAGKTVQIEEETPLPGGATTHWLSFKFPIQTNGQTMLAGISVDITQRKAAEKLKDEFISVVSHELRTPLTAIRGGIGLLAGGALGQLSPPAFEVAQVALANSERLRHLIDDLLDVEKIESGQLTFDWQTVPLAPLLRQCARQNGPFAEKFGIQIQLEIADETLEIYSDAGRVTQIVTNLLSNAIKFSPSKGQVTLRLSQTQHDGKNWAKIAVHNCGDPIPEGFRARIFSKFAQADSSDTRAKGGTGLGLAISKSLVQKLGGNIGFHSTQNEGTTFWVELQPLEAA